MEENGKLQTKVIARSATETMKKQVVLKAGDFVYLPFHEQTHYTKAT